MNRRTCNAEIDQSRLLGAPELAAYLSLGKASARQVGAAAGAAIRIGRRVLYDRGLIDRYLDRQLLDQGAEDK